MTYLFWKFKHDIMWNLLLQLQTTGALRHWYQQSLHWQDYLTKQMKVNGQKSNYMIFNFTRNFQFNTRLYLDNNLLDEVKETRLLGVILNNNLTWHSNTRDIVKRCYQRMLILRKLSQFSVPVEELVHIYCMYIRSVAEQSCVVWSSALTRGEEYDLERVQRVTLRVIFKESYESLWRLEQLNWA